MDISRTMISIVIDNVIYQFLKSLLRPCDSFMIGVKIESKHDEPIIRGSNSFVTL